MGIRIYEFECDKDLDRFNQKMKTIGLSIQKDLFGGYVAFLDECKYSAEVKKSRRISVTHRKSIFNANQDTSDNLTEL
jgi:hypothetical protein